MEIYLTASEMQNLKILHLSEKDAAKKLVVSIGTIKRHRYNIARKFLTQTRAETILKALKMGVVKIEDYLIEV